MQQHIAILIIIVNLWAAGCGIWTSCKRREHSELPRTQLKAGLAAYLATANNREEMQSRSDEIAKIMIQGADVADACRILVYRYLRYTVYLAVFNLTFAGLGMWLARTKALSQKQEIEI